MNPPTLEFEGVTKRYGQFTAVDDLSFSVPAGSVFGFLGPNGAGKTSSLRMALDIVPPTAGTIRLLGRNRLIEVRDRVGYLPEEKGLYRNMKAWEVIAFLSTLKGLSPGAARRRAFQLLEWAGLAAFAKSKVSGLSKGMGQKVQVMAAIAHDPELAILDEPFSGLDPVNQAAVEGVVQDFQARGRTVVFSTHVMAHADRMCTHLLIIARGRKLFAGSPAEARRLLPNRVQLGVAEAGTDLESIRALAQVGALTSKGPHDWECELRPGADGQAVLEACFLRQIRLRRFAVIEPTLHDVFVHLVGPLGLETAAPKV